MSINFMEMEEGGMKHSDFEIGMNFTTAMGRWHVTDIGTRVVVAIPETKEEGWMNGPPYAVVEVVFDENDFAGCERLLEVPA